MASNPVFHRLELLVGSSVVRRLQGSRAIVFGVGGVGSWCAEALVRNGLGAVTVVDSDTVCVTNVNRQLQATTGTVGQSKVDLLAQRLRSIHPRCQVEAHQAVYEKATRDRFELPSYDYVVDAIDSYTHKLDLIEHAWEVGATLVSSMGAACRVDSTAVRTTSVWNARKDPFARIVRKGLRKRGFSGDFQVVYSEEDPLPPTETTSVACGTHQCFCPHDADSDRKDWCETKLVINGSAVHVTAAFGMALAGLVLQDARAKVAAP
ncbi:MAG TPA: tRNA threonylcarbamoyladenosine dehydratase [Fibrobacteria bacterium]|nr:tRNA threonylcarbamoyladenosine dehydratase [Fibrobacteria bacterium]HOX50940.1 tRNA threonylcarbamoyladenosine dehydratase [Fibrobacteria bacterium]